MSGLYFDVWPANDPNGTALGELTAAYGRQFKAVHQAMGSGQFTINRHDAQAAWAATDNLVRVRRVAGGPFAYDSANYIGAFWIEGGDDILLDGEGEEGGEELTRGGRSEEACLRWARLYPDAFDSRNDKFTTTTRIDGNWHVKDRTAGEVLAIFLRDLDDRTPDPLPFVTKDFGVVQDSTNTDWTDTGTDWAIPVGTTGLDLLETCVSGGLFYRVTPAFLFHAYEDEPGDDLTASITFEAGVNIVTAAERQIQARETVGRTIVQGTKESGKLKYREVVNATVEAALPGRREGFVEYKRTPTNAKLDKAGNRYINRTKRHHDGIPTLTVAEDAWEAFADYVPGDQVTLLVSGEYASVAVRIYSISLEEDEAGNVDPTLEFEESPFDPAKGDEAKISGGGGGGGGGNCADCPPIPPFVPGDSYLSDCTDGSGTYTPQAAGTYPPLNSFDSDGWIYYGKPGTSPPSVQTLPWTGTWSFAVLGSGGTPDFAGDCTISSARVFAVGPGTLTVHTAIYSGARTLTWWVSHLEGSTPVVDSSGSAPLGSDIAATIPDDGFCVHFVDVRDDSATCGSKWGFAGYTWAPSDAYTPGPLEGQTHVEELAGDGSTVEFTTNYPYAENSLEVWVDGLLVPVTQTDPTAGTFTFETAPADGAVIIVRYQNAGTTATGATNAVPVASTPTTGEPIAEAHIADTSDAHDASAVSVLDTAGNFTGTDVEAVLAELAASGGPDTSLTTVAASGATETLDVSVARTHDVTLDADCTFTFSGAVTSQAWYFTLVLRQDGTGGWDAIWPGSVVWSDGSAPTLDTTASTFQVLTFFTLDGGTTWHGFLSGAGGSTSPLTTKGDLWGYTTADARVAVGTDGYLLNADSTATAGVAYVDPTSIGHYEVLMASGITDPPDPVTNPDGDDWVYGWVVP